MNIGKVCSLILISSLGSGVFQASANSSIPESSHDDWTGFVNSIALPDGSTLFEYTARSFSGRTEGAMLALGFVPRFSCAPFVALRVKAATYSTIEDPVLLMSTGNQSETYSVVRDTQDDYLVYSIAATNSDVAKLRRTLDISPRVSFSIVSQATLASNKRSNTIMFSLIGSRLSTQAAEKYCQLHIPVPYIPR